MEDIVWLGIVYKSAFFDLYAAAEGQDDWEHTVVYKASDTGILDAEELEAAQSMMSVDQYAQGVRV